MQWFHNFTCVLEQSFPLGFYIEISKTGFWPMDLMQSFNHFRTVIVAWVLLRNLKNLIWAYGFLCSRLKQRVF